MAARKTGLESARSKAAERIAHRPAGPDTATEIARMEGEGGAQSAPDSTTPEYRESVSAHNSGKPGLAANKARQGVTGHGVSYVLGISLAGAVVVFLLLILWVY